MCTLVTNLCLHLKIKLVFSVGEELVSALSKCFFEWKTLDIEVLMMVIMPCVLIFIVDV